MQHRLYKNVKG